MKFQGPKEYWFIISAAILYGTITVGGQFFANLGLSLYEISFYAMFFISLILLPIVLIKRQYLIKKEMFLFFIIYGLIGALLELTQFGGIVLGVPVAIVALLLYSQPIWTTIFGKLMLREKITSIKIIAVALALAGVIVLLKPWNIESVGPIAGIISALLGGLFLSLWVIYGRKSGISNQHYITTIFGYTALSSAWILLIWPIANLFIHEPNIIRLSVNLPSQYWLYFLIFALISGVIPHSFFFRGTQKVHASIAGIILLLEPVSAIILAMILFAQPIGFNVLFGGALILFSNYLVLSKNKTNLQQAEASG